MSQRDLAEELRSSRITAPDEVRDRVRLIAAADRTPARRVTWRRAFIVVLPVAAALAAAIVVNRSPDDHPAATPPVAAQTELRATPKTAAAPSTAQHGAATDSASPGATLIAPSPTRTRAVRYGVNLALRLRTARDVSDGVKRALQVTASLGGYPVSVHATSHGDAASADLSLKVPRSHVQQALGRLSALGTITSEQVDLQDVQGAVDTTDRTIARLQQQLRVLRTQPQTSAVKNEIAAVTARVERLQREKAAALRAARFATVSLHLQTKEAPAARPHRAGPLHGLGIAFHWIWIGAAYALALGLPLIVLAALGLLGVRVVRRRREDSLLSSP